MGSYIVYTIINTYNNHQYIGSTTTVLKIRAREHLYLLNNNKHYNKYLQDEYNQYKSFFEFRVLEYYDSKESMLKGETHYIRLFGGVESINVFNFQDNITKNKEQSNHISESKKGRTPWNKGRKMTPEEIEVNRKSHIGIKRSLESIEKQKQSIANNSNFGNKGKHLSEETKRKISEANKGKLNTNKGKVLSNHKYDNTFINRLRQEYTQLRSYAAVARLHNGMDYSVVRCLILYGSTGDYFKGNKWSVETNCDECNSVR